MRMRRPSSKPDGGTSRSSAARTAVRSISIAWRADDAAPQSFKKQAVAEDLLILAEANVERGVTPAAPRAAFENAAKRQRLCQMMKRGRCEQVAVGGIMRQCCLQSLAVEANAIGQLALSQQPAQAPRSGRHVRIDLQGIGQLLGGAAGVARRFENDCQIEAVLGVVAVGFDRCRKGFRRSPQISGRYSRSATPAQLQRALDFGRWPWVCLSRSKAQNSPRPEKRILRSRKALQFFLSACAAYLTRPSDTGAVHPTQAGLLFPPPLLSWLIALRGQLDRRETY